MKKFILILSILSLSHLTTTYATEIKGGVTFNVDSARNYVQQEQSDYMEITGPYRFEAANTERVVYSKNNQGEIIGITVQYINEPNKAYIYNKRGNLIYMDKYDKPVNVYPHRGYRYDLSGNLILTSLSVTKNELYRFSPDGKLIAHSINGTIYDENGRIIGTGK